MTWNEFWQGHGKQNYTPVFNSFLESLIANPRVPLPLRQLAWVLRNSWGRHSDAVVNEEGVHQGQIDCARDLKLFDRKGQPDRKKVNPGFQQLAVLNLLRFEGRDILPVDNPLGLATFADSSPIVDPLPTNGEEGAKLSVSQFVTTVWSTIKPAAYEEYQTVERRFKELRTDILSDFKAYQGKSERGATSSEVCPEGDRHDVGKGSDIVSEGGSTLGTPSLNRTSKRSLNGSAAAFSPSRESKTAELNTPPPITKDSQVSTALNRYETPDRHTVLDLIRACRDRDPSATADEIVKAIHEKGQRWRGPGLAFFLKTVPPCFPMERRTENPVAEDLPDHVLPSSMRRLRYQLREAEAALDADPGNEGLRSDVEAIRGRLELEAREYGLERKPARREAGAPAQKAGRA